MDCIVHGVAKSRTRLSDFHFHFTFNFSSGASLVAQSIKNLPAMQEIWVQLLGQEDPLEKEMVTLSSILAWRIPMDKGAWQATVHGLARVGHNLATKPPPPISLPGVLSHRIPHVCTRLLIAARFVMENH